MQVSNMSLCLSANKRFRHPSFFNESSILLQILMSEAHFSANLVVNMLVSHATASKASAV